MRRRDREISGKDSLAGILERADSCRIAFAVGGEPYIVALSFGFAWEGDALVLYFHCAREGRKLDAMRANPRVCFQLDADRRIATGDSPCDWGMKYESVVGFGALSEIVDDAGRRRGLDLVMDHYGWKGPAAYDPKVFGATAVLALRATEVSGKRKG